MSYSKCPDLHLDSYVGQFHAAICRCKVDKDCYKKRGTIRQVSNECFNVHARRKKPVGFISFGDGEPTVQPAAQLAVITEQFPESP